ncbi:hypothetical protein [Pseudomonas chlororaphis]|uniref:hypothetical protein n=1 Tax=Pseudomonas chlororaphis TaxID=587753 RepID=UPI000F55A697|nr:hypothetical protein [Pseudomonas chlororaphis]QFS53811.1 hypothetical protein FD951_04300 [Pseudomonas chlororaphis subsp. aurantiaca]
MLVVVSSLLSVSEVSVVGFFGEFRSSFMEFGRGVEEGGEKHKDGGVVFFLLEGDVFCWEGSICFFEEGDGFLLF